MNPLRILAVVAFLLASAGCGTLDRSGAYAGDELLYRADMTISTSYDVLHSFVKWEYDNRSALTPQVSLVADRVRINAKAWISSAIALRDAYALNPTPETRKGLQTALGVLQAALHEATTYMARGTAAPQPTPTAP